MRRIWVIGAMTLALVVAGGVFAATRSEPTTTSCAGVGVLPDPAPLGASPEEAVAAYAAASRTAPYVEREEVPEHGNAGFVPDPLPNYGDYPVLKVRRLGEGSYRVSGACIESVQP